MANGLSNPLSRRAFVAHAGLAGAGLAAASAWTRMARAQAISPFKLIHLDGVFKLFYNTNK